MSSRSWGLLVGATPRPAPSEDGQARVEWPEETPLTYNAVAFPVAIAVMLSWGVGTALLILRNRWTVLNALMAWGVAGSVWWILLDLWEWLWIAAGLLGWQSLATLLTVTPEYWLAFCASGWVISLAGFGASSRRQIPVASDSAGWSFHWRWLLIACGIYIVVFTTMNWRLYFNLLVPHGDSAMYEEHLWNILHGKNFRSYLDNGRLFFGEHIQFVHLFLIPLYVIWPSHLLLELTESVALAVGAIPVFWMVYRHGGSRGIALAASVSYLLYTPMQFLDIEIDLKTFRPEAFGIPLLLMTLDQLDRRNWRGFLGGLLVTLTVKEDYALIFGPLGLWIATQACLSSRKESSHSERLDFIKTRQWFITGLMIAVGSVIYLWLATRVVMPWFRSGVEVHYARYFEDFGKTPEEIVVTMATRPGLLIEKLATFSTILYALALLAPIAFIPLLAPGRLMVGLPFFLILCLNQVSRDPRHQFHAPLVAIVFWALAAGIPPALRMVRQGLSLFLRLNFSIDSVAVALLRNGLWSSALFTGAFITLSPVGVPFWDTGSSEHWPCWNWRSLYSPNRRAELFPRILPLIPRESRVASTDFVHPRFTHFERSYDYSDYRPIVPDDTDFIVIDTQHPYSKIKRPEEIKEFRDHPEQWELLPDNTEGFFIVLKRKRL